MARRRQTLVRSPRLRSSALARQRIVVPRTGGAAVRTAPPFARRAARDASRQRERLHSDLVARLVDVSDVASLAQELGRAARALARAESCEFLWRGRDSNPGSRRGGRSRVSAARRVRAERAVVSHDDGRATAVLPVRHAGRTLALVRAVFVHPPEPGRIEALRRYLTQAGAALARIAAEDRLHRQHRRYQALLDSLPDACVLLLSPQGQILDVRGHAPQLVGADPSRWVGLALSAGDVRGGLVHLQRGRLRTLLAAARESGRAEIDTGVQADGHETPVCLTLVDLGVEGEMVCVLRDLTGVKAMEDALLQRNEELRQAAERLREIDVLKNEFLSNVSHELRTPLTAIIAYAEALLLSKPDPDTQQEFLKVICDQGQKLQGLIAGLLDMAKLESLATELKLQMGSLNDVVRSAVVTVRPSADKNHIKLETQLAAELPEVWLDELRAQQIVWNLLNNAVKFSPAGTTIRVRTWADDVNVCGAVSDQGIGIAPEHQKLIFEKFVQVDGSMNRRQGGVGLGLDLVKHLVELHGGTVGVESTPGEGSTFTFTIPIEKRQRPRLAGAPRTETAVQGKD